jgi:hypothetical protein
LTGLLLYFLGQADIALRYEVSNLHRKLDLLESKVQHNDEVGTTALFRHLDQPMAQAHSKQDRCACPPLHTDK